MFKHLNFGIVYDDDEYYRVEFVVWREEITCRECSHYSEAAPDFVNKIYRGMNIEFLVNSKDFFVEEGLKVILITLNFYYLTKYSNF